MFNVVFAQLKGLIGRTFILAGLLPAAIVIVGYTGYLYGAAGVLGLLGKLIHDSKLLDTDLAVGFFAWMVLSVLFVALRHVLLHIIESLPGPLLSPLRYYFEFRMLRRRALAQQKKDRLLYNLTAVDWYKKNFAPPQFVPPFVPVPDKEQALSASGYARRICDYLADKRYSQFQIPSYTQFKMIRDGMSQLYTYGFAKNNDPDYQEEINAWKTLLANTSAERVMSRVSNILRRQWSDAHNELTAYPDREWIKPTRLGNHMSALDDYSQKRYHIDTANIWVRLWWVISGDEKKEVLEARFQVELLVNISASFLLLFLCVAVNIAMSLFGIHVRVSNLAIWEISLFMFVLLVLGVLAYRAAVFSMLGLKEKITSLIDLHRHVLLRAMGYEPKNVKEELELFKELHAFFTQASTRNEEQSLTFTK